MCIGVPRSIGSAISTVHVIPGWCSIQMDDNRSHVILWRFFREELDQMSNEIEERLSGRCSDKQKMLAPGEEGK